MEKHVNILAIIYIVWAILGFLGSGIVMLLFVGTGALAGFEGGEETVALFLTVFGLAIGGIILITSIPTLIAGIGLLKFKNWARILALILAFLSLLEIPFGTAVGIYAMWVLFNDRTIRLFDNAGLAKSQSQAEQS
jgi:hypothetical protein